MTSASALAKIKDLAAKRRVLFTVHAVERMEERRVSRHDVFHAIAVAAQCSWDASNTSWTIRSEDADGDHLVMAVIIDGLLVIKTVY